MFSWAGARCRCAYFGMVIQPSYSGWFTPSRCTLMPAFMLKLVSSVIVVAAISIPYLKEQLPLYKRKLAQRNGRRAA